MLKELHPLYTLVKRLLDIIVGGILLLISTPLIVVAAIAIRIESPGNPLFLQTRVGIEGRPFTIVKLRGMYVDARKCHPELYNYRALTNLHFYFHNEHDPRVTATGRLFRRTSIDELPNLLNVVLGSMTLVGPRPEIPEVLTLYGGYASPYTSVKPGVTCLSKITGRDRLTKEETVKLDLQYVDRMSFWLDMKILWSTCRSVILRRDVFPKPGKNARPSDREISAEADRGD